jgi:predicted NAD-dependent protein-ADP-ribosyltransferase YbiA (DUF1768 family)
VLRGIGGDQSATTSQFKNCEMYDVPYVNKAILFNDVPIANQILQTAGDPKQVKFLGRKVRGFDEKKWNEKKFEIVRTRLALHFERLTK